MSNDIIGNDYSDLGSVGDNGKITGSSVYGSGSYVDSNNDIRDSYGNVCGRIDSDGDVRDGYGNVVGHLKDRPSSSGSSDSGYGGYHSGYSGSDDSLFDHNPGSTVWKIICILGVVAAFGSVILSFVGGELGYFYNYLETGKEQFQMEILTTAGLVLNAISVGAGVTEVDKWLFSRFGCLFSIALGVMVVISVVPEGGDQLIILLILAIFSYIAIEYCYLTRRK